MYDSIYFYHVLRVALLVECLEYSDAYVVYTVTVLCIGKSISTGMLAMKYKHIFAFCEYVSYVLYFLHCYLVALN